MNYGLNFPDEFLARYADLCGDPEAFVGTLSRPPLRSFRVNRLKGSVSEVIERMSKAGFRTEDVPWYERAFVCQSGDLSHSLERFLGTIYIQELASMLPPLVAAEEIKLARLVLDACAAPGSKATMTAELMGGRGTLVANDRNYGRVRALKYNLNKAGVINAMITNYELQEFPKTGFDVVLLDVPCSAEGTVRKSRRLFETWSVKRILGYSQRQKDLIIRGYDLLREGGTLVYSTCSMAPEENEEVIDYLLRKRPAEVKPVRLDGFVFGDSVLEWEGKRYDSRLAGVGRVWPHLNDTDGFFVARVTK